MYLSMKSLGRIVTWGVASGGRRYGMGGSPFYVCGAYLFTSAVHALRSVAPESLGGLCWKRAFFTPAVHALRSVAPESLGALLGTRLSAPQCMPSGA